MIAFLVAQLFRFLFMQIKGLVTLKVRTKWCKNHNEWNTSGVFPCIELKLSTVLIFITKFHVHCDISMATQWAPSPPHPKSKIRISLVWECYLLLIVIQWVRANMNITQHKHKPVRLWNNNLSVWEGRGLVTSMLLWWHHNHDLVAQQLCVHNCDDHSSLNSNSVCTVIPQFVIWRHKSSNLHFIAGETKNFLKLFTMLYMFHNSCKPREDIYFRKSSSSWPEIILQPLDVDLSRYANYGELVFCKRACYKHLTKFERATFKVKEMKRETEDVIRAREPVRTKRTIRSEDWEQNKYVRKFPPVEGNIS